MPLRSFLCIDFENEKVERCSVDCSVYSFTPLRPKKKFPQIFIMAKLKALAKLTFLLRPNFNKAEYERYIFVTAADTGVIIMMPDMAEYMLDIRVVRLSKVVNKLHH